MIKLSYIIPFYNGGEYIIPLLDSIFSSGLNEKEFEIIVVDDKSNDEKSIKILHYYAKLHSNIRIIPHEENLRQGGAKNTGIRAAQGEYIAFADQDDLIPGKGIVKALETALLKEVDMLACRYQYMYDDGSKNELGWHVEDGYTASGKEFCENHFEAGVCVCPWEYLYRREFLIEQNHPYAEKVLLEASDWVEWHLIHAEKVAFCNALIYQWNVRDESTSHQTTAKHAASWVMVGYRKMMDAEAIHSISQIYADKVYHDGWLNVDGTIRRLWKTTGYKDFFPALGETLSPLQQIKFSPKVNLMLRYPRCTIVGLYLYGTSKRLLREIRNKLIHGGK